MEGLPVMNAGFYWKLFLQTGAPEVYLLYKEASRNEEKISA